MLLPFAYNKRFGEVRMDFIEDFFFHLYFPFQGGREVSEILKLAKVN